MTDDLQELTQFQLADAMTSRQPAQKLFEGNRERDDGRIGLVVHVQWSVRLFRVAGQRIRQNTLAALLEEVLVFVDEKPEIFGVVDQLVLGTKTEEDPIQVGFVVAEGKVEKVGLLWCCF